jgi:hypothetical protein
MYWRILCEVKLALIVYEMGHLGELAMEGTGS